MGITVQFRGFGTYPRPQLAELPEEHPRANRTGNWQAAQRRAEKSKFVGKRRPKTPPIRYVVSPLPAPSRLLLPSLPHPSSLRPTTTARQASFFVPKNSDERHLRACSPSFHFAVLRPKGGGLGFSAPLDSLFELFSLRKSASRRLFISPPTALLCALTSCVGKHIPVVRYQRCTWRQTRRHTRLLYLHLTIVYNKKNNLSTTLLKLTSQPPSLFPC